MLDRNLSNGRIKFRNYLVNKVFIVFMTLKIQIRILSSHRMTQRYSLELSEYIFIVSNRERICKERPISSSA